MEHFRNAGSALPIRDNGRMVDWSAIPPDEITLCKQLGVRASAIVSGLIAANPGSNSVAPHPTICAMDFALVHLHVGLKLREWLASDDLTFTAQYTQLCQGIDREKLTFDKSKTLMFAQNSLQEKVRWFRLPWRK
jgi:hypothetical protein